MPPPAASLSEVARRLRGVKPLFAFVLVVVGCRGSTHSEGVNASACAPKLVELAKFYDAVAADSATPSLSDRLESAAHVHVRHLPAIPSGAPADLSKADVLVVGPFENELLKGDGTSLVLAIDADTPWSRIADTLHELTIEHATNVSVAYTTHGAFAGRTPPKIPGAEPDHVDLVELGEKLAKTTASHCPAYAKQLAALQTGTTPMTDPGFMRGLAATLPTCDCGVDMGLLELEPWLVAKPLVTTVPLAASAPGHDAAQTWGDLVSAAKGPVPLALPELPPPPPPPPPRRHR